MEQNDLTYFFLKSPDIFYVENFKKMDMAAFLGSVMGPESIPILLHRMCSDENV